MASGKFVSYLRVSTAQQGHSGLGIEAQRASVAGYLNGGRWKLLDEVVEVEGGKNADRPKLAEALRLCRLRGATLVIARLDRLARNVLFVSSLMESGVEFVAADFPQANRLTIHILAAVAEHEAKAISERTKAALAAAKARGTVLGGFRGRPPDDVARRASVAQRQAKAKARAADLAPVIAELKASGVTSLGGIARALGDRGITAAKGGEWTAIGVSRVIAQLG